MTKGSSHGAALCAAALLLCGLALATLRVGAADVAGNASAWKLSTAVGPAFALGNAGEQWARLIAEKSGGKLAVKFHPGATLAQRDPGREFTALREGAADLAVGSTLYWAAQVPELNVVGLPWLVPDADALGALSDAMKERFDAAIERAGAVALAYAPIGFREIATVKTEIREPADLAGVAVRAAPLPSVSDLYSALGAVPRTMSFAEAQAGLKGGTLGAQGGSLGSMATARLDALGMRHILLWGAIAEVAVFAVNRAMWDGLSDAQRELVRNAARQVARELPKLARAENDKAIAEMQKRGVTVTRVTPSGRAAFAVAARGAYDKWAAVAGDDLVRAAERAVGTTRTQ
jgi:TRAP-type C4-dicarboxylate transport system substrate-binding protein